MYWPRAQAYICVTRVVVIGSGLVQHVLQEGLVEFFCFGRLDVVPHPERGKASLEGLPRTVAWSGIVG